MATARLRRGLLALAAVATLGALWWVESGAGDPAAVDVAPPRRATATPAVPAPGASVAAATLPARTSGAGVATPAPSGGGIDLSRLQRNARGAAANAFEVRSWEPPPQRLSARELREQQAAAPPPPPPQAPPLPFTYLGRLVDGATTTVFLSEGGRDLAVTTGATVSGRWRLDAAGERALSFTYLPLGQRQSLSLGSP